MTHEHFSSRYAWRIDLALLFPITELFVPVLDDADAVTGTP